MNKSKVSNIDKLKIYYLSGTGNTYRTSLWMKEKAESQKINSEIEPIEQADPNSIPLSQKNLVGFAMPTHGFTLPWIMLKFILSLPRGKSTPVFTFATRAGAKYGPLPGYPAGIAGSSIFIAALILRLKGYQVRGMKSVNMPSNWMSLHSGLRKDIVETIIGMAKPDVENFIEKLINRKLILFNRNIIYEFLWGLVLLPISAGYLFFGRFFLAKLFFANNNCNGCGLCADHCPTGSITMIGKKNPRPYWSFTCESCMRCMGYCPHQAIEAGHSWGVLLYFIAMVPTSLYFLSWITTNIPWTQNIHHTLLKYLVFIPYYFLSLFISYRIFTVLIRIPVINILFTFTTFTHLFRRYHEPAIPLKDLPGKRKK